MHHYWSSWRPIVVHVTTARGGLSERAEMWACPLRSEPSQRKSLAHASLLIAGGKSRGEAQKQVKEDHLCLYILC